MTVRDLDPHTATLVGTDGKVYARWRLSTHAMFEPFTLEYKASRAFRISHLVLLDVDEKTMLTIDLKVAEANHGQTFPEGLPVTPGDTYRLTVRGLYAGEA